MSDTQKPKGLLSQVTNLKNITLTIIAIATGITTYLNLVTSNKLQGQLDQADLEFKNLQSEITEKRFSNEQFLLLNREVRESLSEQGDCNQQLLLAMLIDKMLADEIAIRDSIRSIIKSTRPDCSATAYIEKEEAHEKTYVSEQRELSIPSENYRIDVFYLEDILDEAKPRAEKTKKLLEEKYPKFEIRLRMLPASINARSGYRIGYNQIRHDSEEKEIASEIQTLLADSKIFNLENPELYQIGNRTPYYISVFIRNM